MLSKLVLVACCVLPGCVSVDPYAQAPVAQRLQRADAMGACVRRFQESDELIDAFGTRDAQAPRVPGFPHLRVDRVLARLALAVGGDAWKALAWREALAALDDAARRIELGNAGVDRTLADSLQTCRHLLALADHHDLPALLDAATVPDDYSTSMRALGLYPLTRHVFAAGIRRWQLDTLAGFAAHAAADPVEHRRLRYIPAGSLEGVPTLEEFAALGLPEMSPSDLASLILRHAPRFEIDVAGDDDRPGALAWQGDAAGQLRVGVSPEQPVLYVRGSYAQLGGQWLLQLIYTVWLPARPPVGAYDVLAGRLDGVVWRVTLAENGSPLIYDTIHPCGCYHLFIPTERVRARPQPETIDEGLFVPQELRSPAPQQRVVLKLAATTHHLQRAEIESARRDEGAVLALRDERQLRALPLPGGGTRSAFSPDGLIAGSERLERFYFWPMGIRSAGQMRQWGRQATAFVGRRHFDDPVLLDRYFERLP
jgi:hypothetical protein